MGIFGGKAQYVGVYGDFNEIPPFAACPKHVPLPVAIEQEFARSGIIDRNLFFAPCLGLSLDR